MCSVCHMTVCPSGCPNAPEPKPIHTCARCKDDIYDGDAYADLGGEIYCESCIDDMPYCELIPLLGGEWHEASL